ncbi:hypothetical protein EG68_04576 [Paragonimus skrjabini miyazakii]|uniref:Uncharacterized protein n=1 Tax=Paragonimus skrjabini miyazakii TaxID=59628 RepID=A0A8S9YTP1_9TREM|nr:hypothetical protein EG68_04576 [Paragonimus skrjabini miyazakii]
MGGHKGATSKTSDTRTVTTKSPKENITIGAILKDFFQVYKATTPKRLQILDVYLSYAHSLSTLFFRVLFHVLHRLF